jgi:thiamine-phosphate pyrophosphorylase
MTDGLSRRLPILCYVTDRRSLALETSVDASSALAKKIGGLAAAGVDWIQLRERDLSAKALAMFVREALASVQSHPKANGQETRMIVNDRADVAITEGADGVHLGENSLPVSEVRLLIESRQSPKKFLLGASCHSLESAKSAAADGADYIFFGPVFATPSKARFGEPQGVGRLAEVCRSLSIPVLAIGGITLENAAACLTAGATGIAAIRLFQDAPDPAAVLQALRKVTRP